MSTKTKPSKGALRAAGEIWTAGYFAHATIEGLAEIIDRDTAAPELLEACKVLVEELERSASYLKTPDAYEAEAIDKGKAAISKAEGKQ